MRVIGGRLRGRNIAGPSTQAIRPTQDRLRESLFNILMHAYENPMLDARVLDLYAGTGALHSFGAVDNVAPALTVVPVGATAVLGRRAHAGVPDLEYRTCATSSKSDAKAAAERMIGRRETYMSGAA